jgi:hypothetical protein
VLRFAALAHQSPSQMWVNQGQAAQATDSKFSLHNLAWAYRKNHWDYRKIHFGYYIYPEGKRRS